MVIDKWDNRWFYKILILINTLIGMLSLYVKLWFRSNYMRNNYNISLRIRYLMKNEFICITLTLSETPLNITSVFQYNILENDPIACILPK